VVYDETLADRVREHMAGYEARTELKMFGGWGITLHGNLAVGVLGDDLIVRVGPDAYDAALARKGARPFDVTGRPMRGWVFVGSSAVRSRAALGRWVAQGGDFASSLPPKAPHQRRAPRRAQA
jgi:TfoX/Sxy family transcriptional regulator of competence genes